MIRISESQWFKPTEQLPITDNASISVLCMYSDGDSEAELIEYYPIMDLWSIMDFGKVSTPYLWTYIPSYTG